MGLGSTIPKLLSFIILIISIFVGLFYVRQDNILQRLTEIGFSKFDLGLFCVKYENGDIKKFGDKSLNKCTAEIILLNQKLFFKKLILTGGTLGLGEAYIEQAYTIDRKKYKLGDVVTHILINFSRQPSSQIVRWLSIGAWKHWYRRITTTKTRKEDSDSISSHYDIGNDFYASFLDETKTYTCAIWNENTKTLKDAQINKLNILLKKLQVRPGDRVLDIGSGWGYYPSMIYNLTGKTTNVTGIVLAMEQLKGSKQMYGDYDIKKNNNGPHYLYKDYRDIKGPFDRIVSIGMLEHVHMIRLQEFMDVAYEQTTDNGIMVLHYITRNDIYPNRYKLTRESACKHLNFMEKHIFPGGCLPDPAWVQEFAWRAKNRQTNEGRGFIKVHEEKFGFHYARTLRNWNNNFERNWPETKKKNKKYDDRLYRLYQFYFANAEAAFRVGWADLVQQVFIKPNKQEWMYGEFEKMYNNVKNPNDMEIFND